MEQRTSRIPLLAFSASIVVLFLLLTTPLRSQTLSGLVNSYAPVTYIDTCENAVICNPTSFFSVGDRVLLIQMQGATIDTANTPSFGSISSYGFAGDYEFANIASISGLRITFVNKLVNRYDIKGAVQIIKVPTYINAIISGTVIGQKWNGLTGGVIVFESSDSVTFTSGGTINASGIGFRGGDSARANVAQPDLTGYYYDGNTGLGGLKGESIAQFIFRHDAGRGASANGGGGGNAQNAGGGGGSNGGIGGTGGNQTSKFSPLAIGGIGGYSLDYIAHQDRLLLGGGGGSGQENDGRGTVGANGGGLIIIRTRKVNAIAGGTITSNGFSAGTAGVDGAGGGGSGGTIALASYSIVGNLSLTANGGKGGDNDADRTPDKQNLYCYAPGGGGSGGRVFTSNTLAVTTSVLGGKSGIVTYDSLPCFGQPFGASDGKDGIVQTGLSLIEGLTPFGYPTAINHFDTLCSGDSVQIGITGGQNFVWTPAAGLDNPNAQKPIAFPNKTTTYIATYQDYRGCPFVDTVLVVVNQTPTPRIAGPDTLCANDTAGFVIVPAPNTTYTWAVSGGTILSGQSSDSLVVLWGLNPTGKVYVNAKANGAPCIGKDSFAVNVNTAPKPVIKGAHNICNGDTLTLSVDSIYKSYRWSTGATTHSIRTDTAGTYFVRVGINGGCILYSDTVTVVVKSKLQISITASPPNLPDSAGIDTLYLGGTYPTALWNTGAVGDTLVVTDSGYYSVSVVDSNGCSATATIHLIRDPATPFIIVWTDTITASPGDHIVYPIRLRATPAIIPSGDTTWLTTMTFNKTLLAPENKSIQSVINGDMRTLTFTGIRPTPMIQGVLMPIPCIVGFGDTTETVVNIQTFDFTSGKRGVIYRYNGLLKVTTCNAGGTRLYDENGLSKMGQTHPNPTAGRAELDLDLLEDGYHELFLSDLVGRRLMTISSGEFKHGHYSMTLELESLPKGNYMYVLRTPSAVLSRILTIER
jgi:hypothetical protein